MNNKKIMKHVCLLVVSTVFGVTYASQDESFAGKTSIKRDRLNQVTLRDSGRLKQDKRPQPGAEWLRYYRVFDSQGNVVGLQLVSCSWYHRDHPSWLATRKERKKFGVYR